MSVDTVQLRPAVVTDVPAMMILESALFGPDAWSDVQMSDEIGRADVDRRYTVALDGERIIGYAGLYVSPPDADVQTIAVAARDQHAGVGRRLLSAAVAGAWSEGCTRIFLEVRADNAAALALYESAGFERMGRRRRYYQDGGDAVTMRLRRNPPAALDGTDG